MPKPARGPAYYERLSPQPIEVIDAWGLNFARGAAIKYLARAGYKPEADELDDLRKARWFIEWEIARAEERAADLAGRGWDDTDPAPPIEVLEIERADLVPDAAPTLPSTSPEGLRMEVENG